MNLHCWSFVLGPILLAAAAAAEEAIQELSFDADQADWLIDWSIDWFRESKIDLSDQNLNQNKKSAQKTIVECKQTRQAEPRNEWMTRKNSNF